MGARCALLSHGYQDLGQSAGLSRGFQRVGGASGDLWIGSGITIGKQTAAALSAPLNGAARLKAINTPVR
jgi:hypothetical protein